MSVLNDWYRNGEYDLFEFLADVGITNTLTDNIEAQHGKEKAEDYYKLYGFDLDAIINAFEWRKTPEGYLYWLKISNDWQKQFEEAYKEEE